FTPATGASTGNRKATITVTVKDSGGVTNAGVDTVQRTFDVVIAPANLAPVITLASGSLTYPENDPPTAIHANFTVTDSDSANLIKASVAIDSATYASGQDVLAFTPQPGITGSFNATTGVLSLTGSASPAAYQAALRSVTYSNTSNNPSVLVDRTMVFTA